MHGEIAMPSVSSISVIQGSNIRDLTMAAVNASSAAAAIDVQFLEAADVEHDMEQPIPIGPIIGGLLKKYFTYAYREAAFDIRSKLLKLGCYSASCTYPHNNMHGSLHIASSVSAEMMRSTIACALPAPQRQLCHFPYVTVKATAQLRDEGRRIAGRDWPAIEISLHLLATLVSQQIGLFFKLDTFG